MSMTINHNMMAMNATRNLATHYNNLADSTRKLSSGLRVESAADDAAGLAVRELMRGDIATLNQGVRNANDAISLIQTADGALGVIDEKLIRMKELAEQAATGTYDSTQRLIIDSEYQQMASEITRIANQTDFNGIKLLDGTLSAKQFATTDDLGNTVHKEGVLGEGYEGWQTSKDDVVGTYEIIDIYTGMPTTGNAVDVSPADPGNQTHEGDIDRVLGTDTVGGREEGDFTNDWYTQGPAIDIDTGLADLDSKGPLKVHFGTGNDRAEDYYFITISSATASSLGVGNQAVDNDGKAMAGHNISTQENAANALAAIDAAIVSKDNIRAHLGAMQNRLESTISVLTIQSENLQSAESQISDVDVSKEMTEFVRNQTLANAANSMLSQANNIPQMALRLVG